MHTIKLLSVPCVAAILTPRSVGGAPLVEGLSDPEQQSMFEEIAPNALDPSFIYDLSGYDCIDNYFQVEVKKDMAETGLKRFVGKNGEQRVKTPLFTYGPINDMKLATWPGRTFEVFNTTPTCVEWVNNLPSQHILTALGPSDKSPVDTSLHWVYSLSTTDQYTIPQAGIPISGTHLHGGHSQSHYDGNPEFFFTKNLAVVGPKFVTSSYEYANDQHAGTLWYHDHALGITRLNVYAGLAGFYILRDVYDTGRSDRACQLPYNGEVNGEFQERELAFAIQDRMFKENGKLFYPAFPGDPGYEDFITGEGANISLANGFPGDWGPTALAEFFGDHFVVNGKIWPKKDVDPAWYRLRLLNGCDSRFLVLHFFKSADSLGARTQIPFHVIGVDQGFVYEGAETEREHVVLPPGGRLDIAINFTNHEGSQVIMGNLGGDVPFGGVDLDNTEWFTTTSKTKYIMAFDVTSTNAVESSVDDPNFGCINDIGALFKVPVVAKEVTSKLGLFEGRDEFGRLQPLLGSVGPTDIDWPQTDEYRNANLEGNMEGTMTWGDPVTEIITEGSTELWEIWNLSGDAHPIHLHLVKFNVRGRYHIEVDGETGGDVSAGLIEQPVVQHSGRLGKGYKVDTDILTKGGPVDPLTLQEYVDTGPLDVVTILPGEIVEIEAKFDNVGDFVWHCHILSHEDHEMMRVFRVIPNGPSAQ